MNVRLRPKILTIDDWLTSSNKYPQRATSPELTQEIRDNAKKLVTAVNELLWSLGFDKAVVSSGFRPTGVNAKVGGAKASGHLRGLAIDLEDDDGDLAKVIAANPKLLRSYGLMIENPKATKGWCHLDKIPRPDRPSRMFTP